MNHETMDHGDHGMDMSPTSTSGHDPMATGAMDHGESDHGGHGMGNGCKISMLLNYNTIDSCFISENWKVSSTGMFAGSMIGIVLLAIFLEFLRRSVKEFDKFLVKQHIRKHSAVASATGEAADSNGNKVGVVTTVAAAGIPPFRPTFWQQAIRAILHTSQFTVAYFIMLLGEWYLPRFELALLTSHSHVLQRVRPRQHLFGHPRRLVHFPIRVH